MKVLTLVSILILLLQVNAVNRCHYKYEDQVVESLVETIQKIIEELEIAKTSSIALILEDLSQDIEQVLQELSYILDLFDLVDEKDVNLTTKDTKKLQDANGNYTKSLEDLQTWNKVNASNRRKRQTDPTITTTLSEISATNSNTATVIEQSLQTQVPALNFCPSCGTLVPLNSINNPSSSSTPGFLSGTYVDGSLVYPGVANLDSCDGNRPARISTTGSFSPCALQEMMGSNGSYYCNHPGLRWAKTDIRIAFRVITGATTVTKNSGDQFFVARLNFTKDGLTYSTIGYYFIYDFSIEYWDGSQTIRSTDFPGMFEILTCRRSSFDAQPITKKLPCRWSQTNITDANGNYLKTACIIPLAHTRDQAQFYCKSIGWNLYNIQSEDERKQLSDFVLSVQPGNYNIEGVKGFDGTWYCGAYVGCYSSPLTTQWPNGACMAFSYDVKGDQNLYSISSDCNNKFYSICQ